MPRASRHALAASLGASALVHLGLALGALTLTPASTRSELLAIMELAPMPAPAPAPTLPEPKEIPSSQAVPSAPSQPRAVRKPTPRTQPAPEPAPLPAAASSNEQPTPKEPAAEAVTREAAPVPERPPVQARSPSVLSQVDPSYPAAARRDRIQGIVRVEVQLDRAGRIASMHVRKSIPLLDAAALAALRQWRFSPARDEHGAAIAAIVVVPMRFVLR